jgi:Protein of unknown function (DUF1559)
MMPFCRVCVVQFRISMHCHNPIDAVAPAGNPVMQTAARRSEMRVFAAAILIGLLLAALCAGTGVAIVRPHVLLARELATRTQCQNSLRNLSVAIHQYQLSSALCGPLPQVKAIPSCPDHSTDKSAHESE